MKKQTTIREALFLKPLSLVPKHEKIELLAHVLNVDKKFLYFHLEQVLDHEQLEKYTQMALDLLTGKPLQYVTNAAFFYGETLYVDPRVLIPRPETEVMVEHCIQNHPNAKSILDIGTGSGAIAKALAKNLSSAQITALDVCPDALKVAIINTQEHNNIKLLESDLLANIEETKFDIICANLPYIGTQKFAGVDANVAKYEPKKALFAGADGLDLYRRLFTQILNKNIQFKAIYIELADNQAKAATQVIELLLPQTKVQSIKDLNNKIRFLEIKPI